MSEFGFSFGDFGISVGGGGDSVSSKNYKRKRRHSIVDVGRATERQIMSTVDAAHKAGIHPLFAMGAGGATPAPIATGMQQDGTINYSRQRMRPEEAAMMEKQGRLLDAQIKEQELRNKKMELDLVASPNAPGTPELQKPGVVKVPTKKGGEVVLSPVLPKEVDFADMRAIGPWDTFPGMPPAQVVQDEYGDVGEAIYGGIKAYGDAIWNLVRKIQPPKYRAVGKKKHFRYRDPRYNPKASGFSTQSP